MSSLAETLSLTKPYIANTWLEQTRINKGLMESITGMLAVMETQSETIKLLSEKVDKLVGISENLLVAINNRRT